MNEDLMRSDGPALTLDSLLKIMKDLEPPWANERKDAELRVSEYLQGEDACYVIDSLVVMSQSFYDLVVEKIGPPPILKRELAAMIVWQSKKMKLEEPIDFMRQKLIVINTIES